MSEALRKPRSWPAAAHLVLFAAIIALPLLVLLGAMLYRSAADERQRLERVIGEELDGLVAAINRDIERRLAVLEVLAIAPSLTSGDWPAFHAQAKASLGGTNYLVVTDADGRQLINTYVPYGEAPAFTADPASVETVRQTLQPVVSDLFVSQVSKQPIYVISLPIAESGRLKYVMRLALPAEELGAILGDQHLQAGWTSTVWDDNGIVLARSPDHEQWVGKPVPARWRRQPPGRITQDVSLTGEQVLTRAGSPRLAGWTVRLSFPVREIQAQVAESLWIWTIAATLVVILTAVAGYLFGWFFTYPLARVADAAVALGRGDIVEVPGSRIAEVNAVGRALRETQRELESSRLALRYSEQLLGTAADVAQFGAHQYDAVNDRVYRSSQIRQILGAEAGDEHGLETAFAYVHPEDREQVRRRKREILASENQYQLTYRIRRPDGEVRWVMDRGQVERDPAGGALRVIGVLVDITDLKATEQRQRLLFDELNHRVKNTLAIVQSLALQTLRSSSDPQEFGRAFGERLQSLSRAHDLLAQTAWQGAPLGKLVELVLEPFNLQHRRIEVAGPAVDLPANVTITLALMLNELATNAAKYGALSVSAGKVAISWTIKPAGEGLAVELVWREQDGPPAAPPQRRGFGSRLLAAGAQQIKGELAMDFAASGLVCRLRFGAPTSPTVLWSAQAAG